MLFMKIFACTNSFSIFFFNRYLYWFSFHIIFLYHVVFSVLPRKWGEPENRGLNIAGTIKSISPLKSIKELTNIQEIADISEIDQDVAERFINPQGLVNSLDDKCCFKIETKLDESQLEDRRYVKIETHATLPLLRHISFHSGTPLSNKIPEHWF